MRVFMHNFSNVKKRSMMFIVAAALVVSGVSGVFLAKPANAATNNYDHPCNVGAASVTLGFNTTYRSAPGRFCLVESQGVYKAVFQTDGNLVVYRGSSAIWASNTGGRVGSNGFIALQGDGNVVIYNGSQQALWNTGTSGLAPGSNKLVMQSDGNLVYYQTVNGQQIARWSSR